MQIADATTSTDGDLTFVDISKDINSFAALLRAIDNGAGNLRILREAIRVSAIVFDQYVLT